MKSTSNPLQLVAAFTKVKGKVRRPGYHSDIFSGLLHLSKALVRLARGGEFPRWLLCCPSVLRIMIILPSTSDESKTDLSAAQIGVTTQGKIADKYQFHPSLGRQYNSGKGENLQKIRYFLAGQRRTTVFWT